jgi:hypothetical protein
MLASSGGSNSSASLLSYTCSIQPQGLQPRILLQSSLCHDADRNLEGIFQTSITLLELNKQFLLFSCCQDFGHVNNNRLFFKFIERFFFPQSILRRTIIVHLFRMASSLSLMFVSILFNSTKLHFNFPCAVVAHVQQVI